MRGLLAGREPGDSAGTGLLRPALIVDVAEIAGRGRRHVIASFGRFALRDPVRAAESRYNLTARERDVLTLLLSGMGAAAVAERLALAEATVHHYFKQLRHKTGARTLSGMLARVLGATADGR